MPAAAVRSYVCLIFRGGVDRRHDIFEIVAQDPRLFLVAYAKFAPERGVVLHLVHVEDAETIGLHEQHQRFSIKMGRIIDDQIVLRMVRDDRDETGTGLFITFVDDMTRQSNHLFSQIYALCVRLNGPDYVRPMTRRKKDAG